MKEVFKCALHGNKVFYILSAIAIGLLVAGFICPPLAEIHNSVLYGVGEIILILAIFVLLRAMAMGYDTTLKHGDTSLTISNNDDDEQK